MVDTDFVKVAEELYAILDSKSTEQVDAVVVNAVIQQLRDAVNRSTDGPTAYVSSALAAKPIGQGGQLPLFAPNGQAMMFALLPFYQLKFF